ncbi:MAG: hypothetical protein MZV65_19030 [Chromatiales bacterium]|nr:hypothetical protein [Chromatiales bacterium]
MTLLARALIRRHWQGDAIARIDISVCELSNASGQLELFSAEELAALRLPRGLRPAVDRGVRRPPAPGPRRRHGRRGGARRRPAVGAPLTGPGREPDCRPVPGRVDPVMPLRHAPAAARPAPIVAFPSIVHSNRYGTTCIIRGLFHGRVCMQILDQAVAILRAGKGRIEGAKVAARFEALAALGDKAAAIWRGLSRQPGCAPATSTRWSPGSARIASKQLYELSLEARPAGQ